MVSEAAVQDITETGIDFLTQSPMEEVVYTAGEGTVTYTPAENDKNAVITLENATINGSTKAYYQDASAATAAILAAGNIDLVLMGENRITITKAYNNGLFFFNGNVTVKGPGSVVVDTTAAALNGPPAFFVLNGKNATADMGNFILESGDIRIQVQEKMFLMVCR